MPATTPSSSPRPSRPRSPASRPGRGWSHHEATFDRDELRRHVTVLVLTPTPAGRRAHRRPPRRRHLPGAVRDDVDRGRAAGPDRSGRGQPDPGRAGRAPRRCRGPRRRAQRGLGRGGPARPGAGDLRRPRVRGRPRLHRDRPPPTTCRVRVSAEGDGAEAVLQAVEFARALSAATAPVCPRDRGVAQPTSSRRPRPCSGCPGAATRSGWTAGRTGARSAAVVVLLVDGLGWNLLLANLDVAPFLAGLVAGRCRSRQRRLPVDDRDLDGLVRDRSAGRAARARRLHVRAAGLGRAAERAALGHHRRPARRAAGADGAGAGRRRRARRRARRPALVRGQRAHQGGAARGALPRRGHARRGGAGHGAGDRGRGRRAAPGAGVRLHRRPRQRRPHPRLRLGRLARPARAGRPVRPAAAPLAAARRAAAGDRRPRDGGRRAGRPRRRRHRAAAVARAYGWWPASRGPGTCTRGTGRRPTCSRRGGTGWATRRRCCRGTRRSTPGGSGRASPRRCCRASATSWSRRPAPPRSSPPARTRARRGWWATTGPPRRTRCWSRCWSPRA